MSSADFGMIGMAVMGRNLALNMVDHGIRVAAWNLEPELTEQAVAESEGRIVPTDSLEALVAALPRPRRLMMMIAAGKPVDIVLGKLLPLLDEGDIVIDGGNSWYRDTERRQAQAAEAGVHFFGVGVSGGEEGARHGPSLMPGGDRDAYAQIRPVLEAIAARSDSGPCVTYVGPGGAGHFVKMVHNGIEYADMQFIAEAYHLLREVGGLAPPELAEVFDRWNEGPLQSFLIEITARIFGVPDPQREGGWLVDAVLDRAGQKGTGRWTAQVALELGVAIPSIAAAIDARVLSSQKAARVAASGELPGPETPPAAPPREALVSLVHDGLLAAKIGAYAQGMALIATASAEEGWGIDLAEMARIWKAGCIIRARLLDDIMRAFRERPDLPNLLLDGHFRGVVAEHQRAWRRAVALAVEAGVPAPAMAQSLAYYDSYRTADLPQNLTQAQRDAFGAHTYRRKEAPDGDPIHTDWLG